MASTMQFDASEKWFSDDQIEVQFPEVEFAKVFKQNKFAKLDCCFFPDDSRILVDNYLPEIRPINGQATCR